MRFACARIEHLPTRLEAALQPELSNQPLVVLRVWDEHVLDASPDVEASGVRPGDSRCRIEQFCPQAVVLPARETLYQSHHDMLKSVLANFAGQTETGPLGEFFIDIGALSRTFSSEQALAERIVAQAHQTVHLIPSVGIATNKFTALQAARQAALESGHVWVVPKGDERHFLASFPLTILPEPPIELLRRLHLFGITTLGGFADLPHAAVVMQFGAECGFFHDLARGIDPRPLSPESPPPMLSRSLSLAEPLVDRRQVLAVLEHLAGWLARKLDKSGHHAMALSLTVSTAGPQGAVSGHEALYPTQTAGAPVKPPSCDAQLLRRTAGRLLGNLKLASGVTGLTLSAYPLREWHVGVRQMALFEEPEQPRLARLREVLRNLQQRFGETIIRLASVIGPPLPLSIEVGLRSDGTPMWLRWGGWARLVDQVYEFWREQHHWWDQPVVRDYYQVELNGEVVFTVFRDGKERWFLDQRRG
jgi:nucleotidyltransferase/DNA polymerase involved in DNA repair